MCDLIHFLSFGRWAPVTALCANRQHDYGCGGEGGGGGGGGNNDEDVVVVVVNDGDDDDDDDIGTIQ